MSLILLLTGLAQAGGTALWLSGTPDPTLSPDRKVLSAQAIAPDPRWGEADQRALDKLKSELEACRPLKDVFDGELQILRRLGAALQDVHSMRDQDRALVWEALLFQGYAAHRYFQSSLATDPAAAPYRVEMNGRVEVLPWVQAIGLDPDRVPTEVQLPDPAEMLGFQEQRARLLLAAPASIQALNLAPGARLIVNGREATADSAQVLAGHHWVALTVNGELRQRLELDLQPGQRATLTLQASAAELEAVGAELARKPKLYKLPAPVLASLSPLEAPIELWVPGRKAPLRYEVQDGVAIQTGAAAAPSEEALALRLAAGGGWIYDGNFALAQYDEGAPAERSTVNSGTPMITVELEKGLGPVVVGLGADALYPLGDWHSLPVGEGELRLRAHPHLNIGLRPVQLSGGFLFPWHPTVGARAHLPLSGAGRLELSAAYLYGFGLSLAREEGQPDYAAERVQSASLSIGTRLARTGAP